MLIAAVLTYQIWLGKQVVSIKSTMSRIITWLDTTQPTFPSMKDE